MADIEKVIKGLECCLRESEHIDDNPCADCPYYDIDSGVGGKCIDDKDRDALELLKSMQGVPTWSKAEEPPKDDCECLVLTDDGLKFAEWRDGEWGTWQADFINGGFVDDKWEKLPWTVKFWMYDIVVSN